MQSLKENQCKKKTKKYLEMTILTIYFDYISKIKLKIVLYEPFMLNMVWKSTERYFGNLSLEKYGILKWKMCRNPDRRPLKHFDASTVQVTAR